MRTATHSKTVAHIMPLIRVYDTAGNSLPFVIDKPTITGTLKASDERRQVSIGPKTVAVKDAYPLVLEIVTYHQ